MWASSERSMELLRLSLSLSSERAEADPHAGGALGDERGDDSYQFACSSESEGEMLALPGKGKNPGVVEPPMEV